MTQPTYIDTHCHLDLSRYGDEREDVIRRALDADVSTLVAIGAGGSLDICEEAIELASAWDEIYATVGFHPHEASAWESTTPDALHALARHPRVVAVGETGLDYHYDYSPRDVQERVFREQIEIAADVGKPIVVHNRNSDEDCRQVLRTSAAADTGGVVHCFSSSWDLARTALDLGFYIGFTGIVSFRNAESVREVLLKVPRDRIVIETDSPFLAPVPRRGKRNEPAWVVHVAQAVADTLRLPIDELADLTTRNARALYRLPAPEPE